MHFNIKLNDQEICEWESGPQGRDALLSRVRALADAGDVESISLWAGQLFLGEVAPTKDRVLMQRLREKNLQLLANLIDPDQNADDVERNRLAEEIRRAGELFGNAPDIDRDKRRREKPPAPPARGGGRSADPEITVENPVRGGGVHGRYE